MNNKGADQTARMRRLICPFVGRIWHKQIFSNNMINIFKHVFIDFKKAFDRVWHVALRATMRKNNINANIIRDIENLYDKAQSAVLFNGSTGDWFRTTVGERSR